MWQLIASQLRYRWQALVVAAAVSLGLGLSLTLGLGRPQALWSVVALCLGGLCNLFIWVDDQRERRLLLWAVLPLRPAELAAARLLTVLLVQAAAGALALFGLALSVLVTSPSDSRALPAIFGAQAFALIAILIVYLQEELTLVLSSSRLAIIGLNIALMVLAVGLALNSKALLEGTWAHIALAHGLAAAAAAVIFALFVRRRSFLVGIHCATGFPVEWSAASKVGK